MPNSTGRPFNRARQPDTKPKSWYRVDNAFKDDPDGDTTRVYIYDEIGDSWFGGTAADDFIKEIAQVKTPNIELHLNSPGGDIFDGVAIYNALKAHPAHIKVVVDALAASAASFIAQAGEEIVMTKAATMMIHDGSGLAYGPASVMRDTADLLDKLSNTIAEIYADRAGQTTEFWRNLMIEEVWYNAREAVESGLADKIGEDTDPEDDAAAEAKWDLSIFNYAGRSAAPNPFTVRQRIANRLKEMTVPKNEGGDSTPNPESPEVNPDADTTEGKAGEVDEEREEENPGVDSTDTGAGDSGNTQNQGPGNSSGPSVTFGTTTSSTMVPTFKLNGVNSTDFKKIQAHIEELETYRNESLAEAKKNFVLQLAADKKIAAPQIDALTAYALELDDEGYTKWKATWDVAAPLQILEQGHGGTGTSNHDGSQTDAADERTAKIELYTNIIKRHVMSGLNDDAIKGTDSYKALVDLDPSFDLQKLKK